MTNLPDVTFTIEDGLLGQVPPSVAGASVKLGVCSGGTPNTLYSFGDTTSLTQQLGSGPLVEAIADTLTVAGGPVYAVPLNPTTYGAAGGVTHAGPGTGALTVTLAPKQSVTLKIVLGGTNGTATFQISINGGAYGPVVTTAGGTFSYPIPGTLTTVTLAASQTWVAADTYTIGTDGSVTHSGSGPAGSNVTHTDSPMDVYSVLVTMVVGGAVGTATFTVSVDGGNSTSAEIATAAAYAIPGTGVVLNFSGTFTAADTYVFTTTSASANNTDVTNGFTYLLSQSVEWGFAHLVGSATSSSGAAATAAVVDTQMQAAQTAFRFVFTIVECPTGEGDATVAASFASFASVRVSVVAGDVSHVSALDGTFERRNFAICVASRVAAIQPGEDPGWVGSPEGSIPNIAPVKNGVSGLFRDEYKTPLLDAARFTTARTYADQAGYYITNARMMAPGGSDYTFMVGRRVMDVACRITRKAELPYINGSVRVNPKTGFIDERDAQAFEAVVNSQLKAGLVSTGDASAASVVMNRTTDILSTDTDPVNVRVTPLGYLRGINNNIGFSNPALAA